MRTGMLTVLTVLCLLAGAVPAEDSLRGRTIAAACFGCHGPGTASGAAIPPIILGAPAPFIEKALKSFRDGTRSSTIMQRIAKGYSDEDIAAVARYFASMEGEGQ